MIKQKIKVKIHSGSSIRLGRGSYAKTIIISDTLRTVPEQKSIVKIEAALYKSYKTS